MAKKDYFFEYDGENSNNFGLLVKDWNYLDSPEKNIEEIEIDGRDGSLFVDYGNYKNRIIDITCLVDLRGQDKNTVATKLNEWLLIDKKYKKLRISDDMEHYFEAVCINKLSFVEIIEDMFEILITFSAKPFKKNEQNDAINVLKGETVSIFNPYKTESETLIKVTTTIAGIVNSFWVNNIQYRIANCKYKEFYIDTDLMYVYADDNGIMTNCNEAYQSEDFPVLGAGENIISGLSNIEKLEIIPNFKCL